MDETPATTSDQERESKRQRLLGPNDEDEESAKDLSGSFVNLPSVHLQDLFLPQDIGDKIPPSVGQHVKLLTNHRLNIAKNLGLAVSELKYSDIDMSIKWHGMSSNLVTAAIEGRLEDLAASSYKSSSTLRIKNEEEEPELTDYKHNDEHHLTTAEQAKLQKALGQVPVKCSHWEAVEQLAAAQYPVRREFTVRLISELKFVTGKLINSILKISQDGYEFPDNQAASKKLVDLPKCVLFLAGVSSDEALETSSFDEPLAASTYETIREVAGTEVEDLLKFIVIFMSPSATVENSPLYWLSIRPKLKPLLEMGFIKDQQHLGDRLLEALDKSTWIRPGVF